MYKISNINEFNLLPITNEQRSGSAIMDWGVLLLGIGISGVLLFGFNNIGGILGIILLVTIGVIVVKFDITHPFIWFNIFYLLYACSYPILILLNEVNDPGQLNETLILEWIALVTFMLIVGPHRRNLNRDKNALSNIKYILFPLYYISIVFTGLIVFYIWRTGLTSKYQIKLDESLFTRLLPVFSLFLIAYALLLAYSLLEKQKIPKNLIMISFIWITTSFLVSGERDLLLKFIWTTVVVYHSLYRKLSKKFTLILGILGVLLVPVLANFKNFAVSGETKGLLTSNLLVDLLNSEFISASRNLQNLLVWNDKWTLFYGETILWDVKRAFFSYLFPNALSPTSWFNETFYYNLVNRGGGNGFSLVAEGYMNFGLLGVIIWFTIFGLIIKFVYKKTETSIIWTLIYIMSMPLTVYILRADFANLLALVTKHVLIPISFIFVLRFILNRINKKHKSNYN